VGGGCVGKIEGDGEGEGGGIGRRGHFHNFIVVWAHTFQTASLYVGI